MQPNIKIKQNSLPQKMGDVYHYYVAVKLMLDNNDWDKCLIEQYGDIVLLDSDGHQIFNIEVKHHEEKKELKIYEEEFQKTLSNWFDIKDLFNENTRLVLMTSSLVSKNNVLENWNKFDFNKKYSTLNGNQKKSNGDYYSNVNKYFHKINKDVNELKELLKKFKIEHSLPNISKIKDEIKKLSFFKTFQDEELKKNKVIDDLYGLIGRRLKDKKRWEITNSQFNQKLRESTTLIQDKILRTNNDIDRTKLDLEVNNHTNKQFIKKLKNIDFPSDIQQQAINNYAKSIIEIIDRTVLSGSLEFDDRLDNYKEDLTELVNEVKTEYRYKRNLSDIEKSQDSYFKIMDSRKIPFMPEEFEDQTTFFQKGYLHILADDEDEPKKICWSLNPEDEI